MCDNFFCQEDDAMNHVEKSLVKRSVKPNTDNINNTSVSVYLQYHNNHHSKSNSNLVDTSRVQDDDKPVIEKVLLEDKEMTDVKGELFATAMFA